MKSAVSFLSVVVLVVAVGGAGIYVIWMMKACKNNYFFCEIDDMCINLDRTCNSKNDCTDGSDESFDVCADTSGTSSWMNIVVRNPSKNTTVADNGTSLRTAGDNKEEDICKSCKYPPQCTCGGVGTKCTIHCGHTEFTAFPWGELDSQINKLILNSSIAEDGTLNWRNDTIITGMKSLVLENHIYDWGFPWDLIRQNKKSLVNIYLEKNQLQHVPSGVFQMMPSLRWLFLKINKLTHLDNDTIIGLPSLLHLDLSQNCLTLEEYSFRELPLLGDLNLDTNCIERIHSKLFSELVGLVHLDLASNRISYIAEDAFANNLALDYLILSGNRITNLSPETFRSNYRMTKFIARKTVRSGDISTNPFEMIPSKTVCPLRNLNSLKLAGIEIEAIDTDMFRCLRNVTHVYFKKFSFCRFAPRVLFCSPNSDGLSSTHNLLTSRPLRMFIWIMAVLTIVGNITVLVSRWGSKRKRAILDVFINNLAAADMLTGFYLITLATKDIQWRFDFKEHSAEWSTSWLCSAIGVLTMISVEVSLMILTVMSLERYRVISVPFSTTKLGETTAWVSMIVIWIFIAILAMAPLYRWKGASSFYGSTALCFPLHLDDPYSAGWEFSAFVFIGLNSMCLILIAVSYGKLFYVIRQTRLSTPVFIRDMEMAFRFFLMVVTDFICWLPIIAFKVAVLYGHEISADLHAWFLVFVLPLNSVVNPFLYTFSTGNVRSMFVQRFLKIMSHVNRSDRNHFEHLAFRNVGHTSDTPLCNSTQTNKRKDDGHICSLTHQDSVTSK